MQRTWRIFLIQMALVSGVEVLNETARGWVATYGKPVGIVNAQHVVDVERAARFWVEPAWQLFFRHTHHVLGITITWAEVMAVMNALYSLGHMIITGGVGLWVFYFRTQFFSLMRNLIWAADALALIGYKVYPTAPPRMTPISYNGHPFQFVDTLNYWFGGGSETNEFAAMPSIHISYALIVAFTLFWTLRTPALRGLALLYPFLMLVAVVVTANHFIMDAIGAAIVIGLAVPPLVALYCRRARGAAGAATTVGDCARDRWLARVRSCLRHAALERQPR